MVNKSKVIFRVDASLRIGTGHVMRCITLADELIATGAQCQFICREHEGHLIDQLRSRGFVVYALEVLSSSDLANPNLAHSDWLGATQEDDAAQCERILADIRPDLLVVDHYGLDMRWERSLSPYCGMLMVIDDLADRQHACDILLDQTFGRECADYQLLVSNECLILCGSQYALLRPEFARYRTDSLSRRDHPSLRELLITMGGIDIDNVTGRVLDLLNNSALPSDCQITIVMGHNAPWLDDVKKAVSKMPWQTQVLVGVTNMAQLMAKSDLAIGAAGATAWERCCLGLPTVLLVLADNQKKIAAGLHASGAAELVDLRFMSAQAGFSSRIFEVKTLQKMSKAASDVTDGKGAERVRRFILSRILNAD